MVRVGGGKESGMEAWFDYMKGKKRRPADAYLSRGCWPGAKMACFGRGPTSRANFVIEDNFPNGGKKGKERDIGWPGWHVWAWGQLQGGKMACVTLKGGNNIPGATNFSGGRWAIRHTNKDKPSLGENRIELISRKQNNIQTVIQRGAKIVL